MGATRYNRHRMSSDMAAYTRLMAQDNGAQLHRLCQQHGGHGTGSGGVANAHFAGGQQLHTGSFLLLHQPV